MKLSKIKYSELNSRQKEIFNFQKLSAVLADYGFNCIKLADDWQGADFLAYHKDGQDSLRVQLKARLTISEKYLGKDLYMAFPVKDNWCLIEHDVLVELVRIHTNWLNTSSWIDNGNYHSASPGKQLLNAIGVNILETT
ncbi:hypothetical protein [Photobacterium leiognathi]|uniref:hypothetical protein n=1 Tax=Photobacterium leiognathi TaxID=553611 RepID=UPI0029814AD5|nr:hypothetical protein [Photobacterium leiognathi]